VVVVLFAQKKAVIFVAAQMFFHDVGQQVDDLMNFFFAHPRNKDAGESLIAEMVEKGNQRLLVGGAIHAKKHRDTVIEKSQPAMIFHHTWRSRGPSNSQKKMRCQVPSRKRP